MAKEDKFLTDAFLEDLDQHINSVTLTFTEEHARQASHGSLWCAFTHTQACKTCHEYLGFNEDNFLRIWNRQFDQNMRGHITRIVRDAYARQDRAFLWHYKFNCLPGNYSHEFNRVLASCYMGECREAHTKECRLPHPKG